MVTQTKHMGLRRSSVPSKRKVCWCDWMALRMLSICCATTDSTSASMRLNSSKQAHAPDEASPRKNYRKGNRMDSISGWNEWLWFSMNCNQRSCCPRRRWVGCGWIACSGFGLYKEKRKLFGSRNCLLFPWRRNPVRRSSWTPNTGRPTLWLDPEQSAHTHKEAINNPGAITKKLWRIWRMPPVPNIWSSRADLGKINLMELNEISVPNNLKE